MGHGHHIVPIRTLAATFGGLLVLTVVTVITSRIDLGVLNIPLALAIAGSKALIVAVVFMALRYDNKVNALVIVLGVVFAIVFVALTLTDTSLRGRLGIVGAGSTEVEAGAPEETAAAAAPAETASLPLLDPAEVFQRYCATCHTLTGENGIGPGLAGLGSRLSRDEILESITDPDAVITEGFVPQVMQATLAGTGFYANVSEASVDTLVTWLIAQ